MNENKILAAILTIATSARESRGSSTEVGKENWRKAIEDYQQILSELDRDSVKKTSSTIGWSFGKQVFMLTILAEHPPCPVDVLNFLRGRANGNTTN